MSDPQTIRELWERVKARHSQIERAMGINGEYAFCLRCDENWPCPDHADAVAALDLLDKIDERITFILDRTVGADFSAADDALTLLRPELPAPRGDADA